MARQGVGRRIEVGPDAFLAAATVEAALNGAVAAAKPMQDDRGRRLFDVALTDGRHLMVRLGSPEEREALAATVHWAEILRPLGVPVPAILAHDLESEFPSLIMGAHRGLPLGQAFERLSLPARGHIAGRLAEIQGIFRELPTAGRFGFGTIAENAPSAHWSDEISRLLEAARPNIKRPGDERAIETVDRLVARACRHLDTFPSVATLPPNTRIFVTEEGEIASVDMIEGLFWGDPRWAAARSATDLIAKGRPTGLAEAWVSLAGGAVDSMFWLYAAIRCIDLMAVPRGDGGPLDVVFAELLRRVEPDGPWG